MNIIETTMYAMQSIKPHRTQWPGKGLRGIKNTIAVASGKGGVGKSTVALNIAIGLAQSGARVGLLDADIYGPSQPLMLGGSPEIEIANDRYVPVMAHGIQTMSIAYLIDPQTTLIWRGPMLAKSLIQMIDTTQWNDLDYLFIDLPPGTGDIPLSLAQKIPLAGAIIVTTPQQVATLDAEKSIVMFEKTSIPILGIIENMAHHVCENCFHMDTLFGEGGARALCEKHNCTLLGQLPLDKRIGLHCDQGTPAVLSSIPEISKPFIDVAMSTALALSKRPLNYTDIFPPITVEK